MRTWFGWDTNWQMGRATGRGSSPCGSGVIKAAEIFLSDGGKIGARMNL